MLPRRLRESSAILRRGELLTAGDVNEVLTNEDFIELGAGAANLEALKLALSTLPHVRQSKVVDDRIQLYFETEGIDLAAINRHCFEKGITLTHLQLRKKSLETKFMELTDVQPSKPGRR